MSESHQGVSERSATGCSSAGARVPTSDGTAVTAFMRHHPC